MRSDGLGRLALQADVGRLALIPVGAEHLLLAGRYGTPQAPDQADKIMTTVIAGVIR